MDLKSWAAKKRASTILSLDRRKMKNMGYSRVSIAGRSYPNPHVTHIRFSNWGAEFEKTRWQLQRYFSLPRRKILFNISHMFVLDSRLSFATGTRYAIAKNIQRHPSRMDTLRLLE